MVPKLRSAAPNGTTQGLWGSTRGILFTGIFFNSLYHCWFLYFVKFYSSQCMHIPLGTVIQNSILQGRHLVNNVKSLGTTGVEVQFVSILIHPETDYSVADGSTIFIVALRMIFLAPSLICLLLYT